MIRSEEGTLFVEGDITIENIAAFYKEVSTLDFGAEDIVLNVSGIGKFDTSFIQVLLSLQKTLLQEERDLLFTGSISTDMRKALVTLGFGSEIPDSVQDAPLLTDDY